MRARQKISAVILALFANCAAFAIEPVLLQRIGFDRYDQGIALTTDANGNVYVTGVFKGTVDFDPGPGVTNLTSNMIVEDVFVAKYSAAGALIWARSANGPGQDYPNAIAVDNTFNVYVAGRFDNTVDFDPGAGTANVTGDSDVFIWKLDADGNFVWVKVLDGTGAGTLSAIALKLDAAGEIYVGGQFSRTTDFDPDAGTQMRSPSTAAPEAYILKLSTAGAYIWFAATTGSANESVTSLDVRGTTVLSCGLFESTTDFDPGAGTFTLNAGQYNAFVWLLDTSGNFVSAKAFSGGTSEAHECHFDSSGAMLITGSFNGPIDCDPDAGTFTLTPTGIGSAFVIKLNSTGSLVWARALQSSNYVTGRGLALDAAGGVYLNGIGAGNTDFDPGPEVRSEVLSEDTYITKLDSNGNYIWHACFNGTAPDDAQSIAVDTTGQVIITGYIQGATDFDPRETSSVLTTAGEADIFLCKYRQLPQLDLSGPMVPGEIYSAPFRQGRGAVPIVAAGALTVSHEAAGLVTTLASATATLTNVLDGDAESLAADPGATGIAVNYDANSGVLQLSGVSSLANYQQVLRTLVYNNTSTVGQLDITLRSINVVLNDGAANGNVAVAQVTVIPDEGPIVSASASPAAIPAGGSTQLTCTATDPEGDALSFSWDFGDGSPASTEQNPVHTYAAPGDYTATVTVTDSIGASVTATVTVHVGRAPTPRFTTSDVVGFVGQPLLFDASFSTDPENAIAAYAWNFGDGSPLGAEKQISRSYTAEGSYTVTLTVTDAEGLSASLSRQIEVLPADQVGLFNSFITYKVKWDRNKTNADSLSFDANVNVGADTVVGKDTLVAVEVAGKRFEGTLDKKLRDKSGNESWQVTANSKKQSPGEVRLKLAAKKTSLGLEFNQAGAVAGPDLGDEVSVAIPVRIEIAGRAFDVLIESEFKFGKEGKKASGSGEGP